MKEHQGHLAVPDGEARVVRRSALSRRDVLELVRDCSSQEWMQPDGKLMSAIDNQGRRFWFITEDVMQAVRDVLKGGA